MRVLFITVGDTTRRTGGYLYHARVFAGLRAHGIQIDEVIASDASLDAQLRAAPGLGTLVEAHPAEVIAVDALARGACAPWLDRWRAVRPLVAMVHELPSVAASDAATTARDEELEAPLLRADRLITVSTHGRDLLIARGAPPDRIHVVPPGFDRLPAGERAASRSDGLLRALCVAQWIPRKGIDTVIRAWSALDPVAATLRLIGETDADPAYATRVRDLIAASRCRSIVVSGAVDDATLRRAYMEADLFVLPSRYEGYGIVYAEALAFGLPVIACAVGPVPELLGGEAALLVSPDDPQALAGALDRLLGDAALRARLAAAARHRARALPSWESAVEGFRRVLAEAAARPR